VLAWGTASVLELVPVLATVLALASVPASELE